MQLKNFISQSIIDICCGVNEAQKIVYEKFKNFPVAPAYVEGKNVAIKSEQTISFDILVKTSESEYNQKQGSAKIYVVDGTLNNTNNLSNVSTNRIQFSVPFYPQALSSTEKTN